MTSLRRLVPTIFMCYRREDSAGHAGRLFDRIVSRLGRKQVFRDVDDIQPGVNFVEAVRTKVEGASVVLVFIGPNWLNAADASGRRRLDDPADLVRVEIATALAGRKRVIPVLAGGASMPRAEQLPADLAPLAHLNAVEVRDSHFDPDASLLIGQIAPRWRRRRGLALVAAMAFGVCVVALGTLLYFGRTAVPEGQQGTGQRQASPQEPPQAEPSAKPGNNPVKTPAEDPIRGLTPEQARLQIGVLGLAFEEPVFVTRAEKGDAAAVRLFVRAGMRPDACDINCDSTAMGAASEAGHLAIVRLLAENGASVDSFAGRCRIGSHRDSGLSSGQEPE